MKGQRVFTRNRAYFFGAAATAMNDLLREYARKRKCRPEGHRDREGQVLLDEVVKAAERTWQVDFLDLFDALDQLKATRHGERRYEVVTRRIWAGATYEDISDQLGVSVATVERDWQAARAWLYSRLKGKVNR
jgi:RNA polymerase sigma factor (sigma-70 family)